MKTSYFLRPLFFGGPRHAPRPERAIEYGRVTLPI